MKKVALIHDWINGFRGGERVLEQLCHLYPDADIFTLFHKKGSGGPVIEKHNITASFLNRLPGVEKYYRYLLPFYPPAIESFDLSGYKLIISTSHCAAKGVIPPPDAKHICYCFTPIRYAWDKQHEYFGNGMFGSLFNFVLSYYRIWDVTSSQRVDVFVGISEWIQKRIKKYYRRDSLLVYPPVDTQFFDLPKDFSAPNKPYYLVVSAFAPYKRIDLAIEACQKLGKRLLVVGGGQRQKSLEKLGGHCIEFLGKVRIEELPVLYQNAEALLFPGEEDFGIVPLEAQACGCPVVAYARGGATETVQHKKTGYLYQDGSAEGMARAILEFEKVKHGIRPEECRAQALKFSEANFLSKFSEVVSNTQIGKIPPIGPQRPEAPSLPV